MKYIIGALFFLGSLYLAGQNNIWGDIVAVILAIIVLYLWMTHNPLRKLWDED